MDTTSSSEYYDIDFSDSTLDDFKPNNVAVYNKYNATVKKILGRKEPTRITLKLHVTENTFSIWETVLLLAFLFFATIIIN